MVQQLLRRLVVTSPEWKVVSTFVAQCAEQLARPGKARCIPVCRDAEQDPQAGAGRLLGRIQADTELTGRLERGEYAAFSDPDQTGTATWVFPLRSETSLVAVLWVNFPASARVARVRLSRLARLCESASTLFSGRPATVEESVPGKHQTLVAANNQLEAVSQARSHAVRNAVHDLQTPLVSLLGYSRLMLREQAGPLTDTQREYLGTMLDSLHRMSGQLCALREFAKPDPLRFTRFDLAAVWPGLVEQIRSHTNQGISVEARFSHQPFPITADAAVLSEGLKGLIEHVIQRTAKGGVVAAGFDRGDEIVVQVKTNHVRLTEEADPADGLHELQAARRAFWLHGGGNPVSCSAADSFSLTVTLPPIAWRKECGLEDLREQVFGSCGR